MNAPRLVKSSWQRNGWLLFVLAGIVVAAFVMMRGRGGAPEEEPEPVVAVETAAVKVGTLDVTIHAIGTVAPRPGYVAEISAPEASRVERILVSVGDRVTVGQALVELDRSVWASRRVEAESALETAQSAYDRAQRLLGSGIVPRKDVDEASAALAAARATLQEAQRLERLGTLRSPIQGVVVELNATLSQPVEPSVPLVEVVDPRGLEVLFHLPTSDAARVTTGAHVTLSRGQEGDRVAIGQGTVRGVSAEVDSATGSVDVRVVLEDAPQLRSGELLGGSIVAKRLENVVLVPVSALVPEEEGFVVYVVDAEDVAHATPVEVGERSGTEAQILKGLEAGQVVVTEGAYGVTDGAKVERGGGGAEEGAGKAGHTDTPVEGGRPGAYREGQPPAPERP